jgi:hypothetical protein
MSHKFRKPKPISEEKAKSALNAITHGLTAGTLFLRTESKGPIENDVVEEMVAAKWQQRRVVSMIAALIDVGMDRMEKEIRDEFQNIDNAVRTALAFDNQAQQSATLARLNRYVTRHARDYHRAPKQLREEQSSGAGPRPAAGSQPAKTPRTDHTTTDPQPPASDHCKAILQNEPKADLTPEPPATSVAPLTAPELVTRHSPLATQTAHRPLATDHCILQNEPKPDLTPEPSTTSGAQLTTSEPATGHSPRTTEAPSPATDRQSELATSHKPLTTQTSHQPQAPCDPLATSHSNWPPTTGHWPLFGTSHSSLATRHSNWPLATAFCKTNPSWTATPDVEREETNAACVL